MNARAMTRVFGLQVLDLVSPAGAMVGIAWGVRLWGAVRGAPHPLAVFGTLAVTGLLVDPEVGRASRSGARWWTCW